MLVGLRKGSRSDNLQGEWLEDCKDEAGERRENGGHCFDVDIDIDIDIAIDIDINIVISISIEFDIEFILIL